jgi:hypothetical protein
MNENFGTDVIRSSTTMWGAKQPVNYRLISRTCRDRPNATGNETTIDKVNSSYFHHSLARVATCNGE